jgi:putative ABC transport system permease protein
VPLPAGIRRAFRLALGRRRLTDEVDDEIAFHLHMRTAELVHRGVAPDVAEAEAIRRFGNVHSWSHLMTEVDRARDARERRGERLAGLWRDLRLTARGLRRQPLFTVGVVLTLALGVGANATMFGIVDRLMLRAPDHVVQPDDVRRLYLSERDQMAVEQFSPSLGYATYLGLLDSLPPAIRQLAVWDAGTSTLGAGEAARTIQSVSASANFFPLLGVRPHLGRFFSAEEDALPAGRPVAVLGYDLWRTDFAGDAGILGRTIDVEGARLEVVGVAPPGFSGIALGRVDLWVPMSYAANRNLARWVGPDGDWYRVTFVRWLGVVARLAPGATDAEADAQLAVRYRQLLAADPANADSAHAAGLARTNPHLVVGPIQAERGPNPSADARVATWLAGVSALVLLIACANVANLLLVRAVRRRREIAVRLALGISRRRLVAQLLAESVLLAMLGAVGALLVAHWGGSLVRTVLMPEVSWGGTVAHPRVLVFTAASALLAGLLAGLAPAVQAGRRTLTGDLKASARDGGARRSRLRTGLLVAQAALSVVLLAGAGLFVRSLRNATAVDLGYDATQVLGVNMDLMEAGYTAQQVPMVAEQLLERARALPGVEAAALTTVEPFRTNISVDLRVPGLDSLPVLPGGEPLLNAVSPEYFRTMGTRIVRGRGITEEDRMGAPRVIVVNETMARVLWPGQEAIGQCVRVGGADSVPCSTVVGVAEEVRWASLRPEPMMQYYVPFAQRQWGDGTMVSVMVRAAGDAAQLAPMIRRQVFAVAPRLSRVTVQPVQQSVEPELRPWRLGASVFSAFGALALVIAAVGLYSVLAYAVAQRAHELGVRMALGARSTDVLRLVVGEGMRVTALGVVIGVAIVLAAAPRVADLLYGVPARDPWVVASVAVVLLLVAALASVVPAWRAARVAPSTALRSE